MTKEEMARSLVGLSGMTYGEALEVVEISEYAVQSAMETLVRIVDTTSPAIRTVCLFNAAQMLYLRSESAAEKMRAYVESAR